MEVQPTHEILCVLDISWTTDIVWCDCTLITVIFYLCPILPNSSLPSILQSAAKLCISEIIDKYSECEMTTVAPWNVFVVFSCCRNRRSVHSFLQLRVQFQCHQVPWEWCFWPQVSGVSVVMLSYNILSSVRYFLQAPWRWRHCILLQCSYLLPRLHDVLTQKTILTVHFELCSYHT